MNGELAQARNFRALQIAIGGCALLVAGLLSLVISPVLMIVPVAGGVLLWMVVRHPISALEAVVAFMPFDFMAISLGKFFNLPYMTLVSALDKEVILLVLAALLWKENGLKLSLPDWLLLAAVMLAVARTAFGGTLSGLVLDFGFALPYLVGRVTILTPKQQRIWATCGVWIVAVLSVLGLFEVFILGEGPRTLLYVAIDSETEGGHLTSSFSASGFTGLREAATMVGPNGFGALCMIALVLWWVYCRNPIPAALIGVGLICSLTRSAWLGVAGAIPLLAFKMHQQKRLVMYAAVALGVFLAAIPILGLTDFLLRNRTGEDESALSHENDITGGLSYAVAHPFGSGNGNLSPLALAQTANITIFETTYPYLAASYGIGVDLCFIGFLVSTIYLLWNAESQLVCAGLGTLVGMMLVMVVTLPLNDRRLSVWAMFPVGLAIRSLQAPATPVSDEG